jgi:hypothetical protein
MVHGKQHVDGETDLPGTESFRGIQNGITEPDSPRGSGGMAQRLIAHAYPPSLDRTRNADRQNGMMTRTESVTTGSSPKRDITRLAVVMRRSMASS